MLLFELNSPGTTIQDDGNGTVTIYHGDSPAGEITYTVTDSTVQIKRTDVTTPNLGIGMAAYILFIKSMLSKGMAVGSDATVSQSAQRVWQKLDDYGFDVVKADTVYHKLRGITTIDGDELSRQRDAQPTLYDAESGTRYGASFSPVGEPVFKITKFNPK